MRTNAAASVKRRVDGARKSASAERERRAQRRGSRPDDLRRCAPRARRSGKRQLPPGERGWGGAGRRGGRGPPPACAGLFPKKSQVRLLLRRAPGQRISIGAPLVQASGGTQLRGGVPFPTWLFSTARSLTGRAGRGSGVAPASRHGDRTDPKTEKAGARILLGEVPAP